MLAAARRTRTRIALLPEAIRPRSAAEAHAIQDAVTAALALPVGAFKASVPADGSAGMRAPIYASAIQASPAHFTVADVPQCGVEGEVAFRFRRDLPHRPAPYAREEVAEAVDALAAIEVVTSRYADSDAASLLDKLADNVSNGGFVPGAVVTAWRGLDLGKLAVTLSVNGAPVLSQIGGHPTGDPLGIAVALVEMMREAGGVREGQYVTCGSCTGLRYLKPGDRCRVDFAGLGTAEVSFVP
ncbi:2-keto-4-pentenoate hydratase [Desertibaculum subflavum]|uniref:2-keto-4-pentenoate hydratase n=1 Tax=Desertibaculum subflavum TaxID=2268458 RepID=UPI000E66478F